MHPRVYVNFLLSRLECVLMKLNWGLIPSLALVIFLSPKFFFSPVPVVAFHSSRGKLMTSNNGFIAAEIFLLIIGEGV